MDAGSFVPLHLEKTPRTRSKDQGALEENCCAGDHLVISDRKGLLRIELLVKRPRLRIAEESDAYALFRIWETYVRARSRCLGRAEGFAVPEQLSQIPPVNTAAE